MQTCPKVHSCSLDWLPICSLVSWWMRTPEIPRVYPMEHQACSLIQLHGQKVRKNVFQDSVCKLSESPYVCGALGLPYSFLYSHRHLVKMWGQLCWEILTDIIVNEKVNRSPPHPQSTFQISKNSLPCETRYMVQHFPFLRKTTCRSYFPSH